MLMRFLTIFAALFSLLSTFAKADQTPPANLWLYLTTDKGVTASGFGDTSYWADQTPLLTGGAGHDVRQQNANYQPVWSNNAGDQRNGHPIMIFGQLDVSNTPIPAFLFTAGTPSNGATSDLTIFVVAKNKNTGTGPGTIVSTGLFDGWQLRFKGNSTLEFCHNGLSKVSMTVPTGWHIFELRQRKGTLIKIGVDGALGTDDTGSAVDIGPVAASSSGVLTVGAQFNGSSPLIGQITELLVYQGRNTGPERKTILTMLGTKYGINIDDPAPVITNVKVDRNGAALKNGATFSAPAGKLTFKVIAKDDSSVQQLAFYNGGTFLGFGTAASGSTYTMNLSNPATGTYKITAIATDDLGAETSSSTPFVFTIAPATPKIVTKAKATAPKNNDGVIVSKLTALASWKRASGLDGSSALTYTWEVTGTPPAAVTFTPNGRNGTNAAKAIHANFTASGTYDFTVHIASPAGTSVDSSTSVVVP